ncbi:hypothetical protein LC612_43380, partial [Nostoc sp. CHAB 5834]|nr:hypothetical protein [Nostoc sp. CHAB 5834]
LWDVLWAWAQQNGGPVPKIHLCSVFLGKPERIPDESRPLFWDEIRQLVGLQKGGRWHSALTFRGELARHFIYHLECSLPWNDGQRIVAFSLWLTERFAETFACTEENLDDFMEHTFAHNHFLWRLAEPKTVANHFRYVMLYADSPWQLSLIAAFSSLKGHLLIPKDIQHTIDQILLYYLVKLPLLLKQEGKSPAVHAWEWGVSDLLADWQQRQSAEDPAGSDLFGWLRNREAITLSEVLAKGGKVHENLDLFWLREQVHFNILPEDEVKELLKDESAIHTALQELQEENLHTFVEVLYGIASNSEENWRIQIPHYVASACAASDGERQHLLFCIVAQMSVATDTVSALRRLVNGPGKSTYRESCSFLRQLLRHNLRLANPWLGGRIRSIVAALPMFQPSINRSDDQA